MAQRVVVTAGPGGVGFPLAKVSSTVTTENPTIVANVPVLQVLGVANVNQAIPVPALANGASTSLTFFIALLGLPSPFVMQGGCSGLIAASMNLAQPVAGLLFGLPALSLAFGVGNPGQPGSLTWSLVAGATYQSPKIYCTIPVLALAASPATSATFLAQALLLGTPPVS